MFDEKLSLLTESITKNSHGLKEVLEDNFCPTSQGINREMAYTIGSVPNGDFGKGTIFKENWAEKKKVYENLDKVTRNVLPPLNLDTSILPYVMASNEYIFVSNKNKQSENTAISKYDIKTGELIKTQTIERFTSMCLHPDGILLSHYGSPKISLIDFDFNLITSITHHSDWVRSCHYDQDKDLAYSVGDDKVLVVMDLNLSLVKKVSTTATAYLYRVIPTKDFIVCLTTASTIIILDRFSYKVLYNGSSSTITRNGTLGSVGNILLSKSASDLYSAEVTKDGLRNEVRRENLGTYVGWFNQMGPQEILRTSLLSGYKNLCEYDENLNEIRVLYDLSGLKIDELSPKLLEVDNKASVILWSNTAEKDTHRFDYAKFRTLYRFKPPLKMRTTIREEYDEPSTMTGTSTDVKLTVSHPALDITIHYREDSGQFTFVDKDFNRLFVWSGMKGVKQIMMEGPYIYFITEDKFYIQRLVYKNDDKKIVLYSPTSIAIADEDRGKIIGFFVRDRMLAIQLEKTIIMYNLIDMEYGLRAKASYKLEDLFGVNAVGTPRAMVFMNDNVIVTSMDFTSGRGYAVFDAKTYEFLEKGDTLIIAMDQRPGTNHYIAMQLVSLGTILVTKSHIMHYVPREETSIWSYQATLKQTSLREAVIREDSYGNILVFTHRSIKVLSGDGKLLIDYELLTDSALSNDVDRNDVIRLTNRNQARIWKLHYRD